MFAALYNPISLSTKDDLNKAFNADQRTKYICGSVIYLEEPITSVHSTSQTMTIAEYMWVEAGSTLSAGVPGMIYTGGFQSESMIGDLDSAASGQRIAFPTVNVNAGQFTWVKLSGHITVAANVNVVGGNFVKVSRGNANVEQGNTSGTVFDEEALGRAEKSTAAGETVIVVTAGRTVKVA